MLQSSAIIVLKDIKNSTFKCLSKLEIYVNPSIRIFSWLLEEIIGFTITKTMN